MKDLMTVKEAAKKVRRTPAALYDAVRRGDLAYEVAYGRVVVSMTAVRAYVYAAKSGPRNGKKEKK